MKTFIKQVIASVTALSLLGIGTVAAAPQGNDVNTIVSLIANQGALTFQAPGDVSLPTITTSTDVQTINAVATAWIVDEARGKKKGQQPGWSLTTTATDFSDGDAVEESLIDVTNLEGTPQNLVANSGSLTGVSGGSANQVFTDADDNGISDPITVATATSGEGRGQYQGDLSVSLTIPANSDAANYTSTLTFTLQ